MSHTIFNFRHLWVVPGIECWAIILLEVGVDMEPHLL